MLGDGKIKTEAAVQLLLLKERETTQKRQLENNDIQEK